MSLTPQIQGGYYTSPADPVRDIIHKLPTREVRRLVNVHADAAEAEAERVSADFHRRVATLLAAELADRDETAASA